MLPSWPHGFTTMFNFCDRHSAELFLYFLVHPSSEEVVGALGEFEQRTKGRLIDGKIGMWFIDNDLAFEGAMKHETATVSL